MSRDDVIWRRRCSLSSRRGQTEVSAVLWIVLMVIVILSLFAIFFAIRAWLATETEDAICASEIRTHSALAGLTNDEVAPQINCPTRVISTPVADNNAANALIAQEMKRCWQQWGKGEINLFGREEGTYCHICSMVTIEGVDEVKGLPQYLDTAKATKDLTYAQYLSGVKQGEMFDDATFPQLSSTTIQTNESLGVVFYSAKGLTGIEKAYSWLFRSPTMATVGGGVQGGIAGAGAGIGIGAIAGTVGLPVVVGVGAVATLAVGGAAVGSALGLTAAMQKPELSTMSIVVVVPLNQEQIAALGCDYAPVAND